MATIQVRGFVNFGKTKKSPKGEFSTFSLSEGQKQKDGTYKKVFYDVANFRDAKAPADGSKVDVSGYLNMKEVEGKTYFNISATEVTVVDGPKGKPAAPEAQKDPWE